VKVVGSGQTVTKDDTVVVVQTGASVTFFGGGTTTGGEDTGGERVLIGVVTVSMVDRPGAVVGVMTECTGLEKVHGQSDDNISME
jgi:hypothetical protein